jgi:guanylate kinase
MAGPGRLFIVSAPSGAGKTSLTRALVPRLALAGITARISVSYTTRAPRPGEQDGVHYHYVSEARFMEMIQDGAFLEHAQVFGRRYGTGRETTDALLAEGTQVLLDIDWQGARQVKRLRPDAVGIFILPPSREELERRLRGRAQDGDETIAARMAEARSEMQHCDEYDYLIVNDVFAFALDELTAIVRACTLTRAVQSVRHRSLLDQLMAEPAVLR